MIHLRMSIPQNGSHLIKIPFSKTINLKVFKKRIPKNFILKTFNYKLKNNSKTKVLKRNRKRKIKIIRRMIFKVMKRGVKLMEKLKPKKKKLVN